MGRRYSVQIELQGGWTHHRTEDTVSAAVRECERLAAAGFNARVKDTYEWGGPALAYREGRKPQ